MTAPALSTYANGALNVSGDNLNTFEQSCDNVAQLRAFIGAVGNQVYIRGTTTANDGGQGPFYWNASGTGPDDNGTTNVVPNGATTGCWTRLTTLASTSTIANNTLLANITGGAAVPVGVSMSNALDSMLGSTRGEVIYRGAGGWAVLAPGAAGAVLTSNGAGADPSYQAVAAGAGALVLLTTQTISSPVATVDFTTKIDSTYLEYVFELIDVVTDTNGVDLWGRISLDGGSTWKAGGSDYAYHCGIGTSNAATYSAINSNAAAQMQLRGPSTLSTSTGDTFSSQTRLYNPSGSTKTKRFVFTGSNAYGGGGGVATIVGSASYVSAVTAINGVRFLPSSGNIASGVFKLYGIT